MLLFASGWKHLSRREQTRRGDMFKPVLTISRADCSKREEGGGKILQEHD
jgi:hypothetical protein